MHTDCIKDQFCPTKALPDLAFAYLSSHSNISLLATCDPPSRLLDTSAFSSLRAFALSAPCAQKALHLAFAFASFI